MHLTCADLQSKNKYKVIVKGSRLRRTGCGILVNWITTITLLNIRLGKPRFRVLLNTCMPETKEYCEIVFKGHELLIEGKTNVFFVSPRVSQKI